MRMRSRGAMMSRMGMGLSNIGCYCQAGHILAGSLTTLLLLLPGVVACALELKRAWREPGGGNPLKGLTLLLTCPLWALITHLYALHRW